MRPALARYPALLSLVLRAGETLESQHWRSELREALVDVFELKSATGASRARQ